jgi:hypothetical protein
MKYSEQALADFNKLTELAESQSQADPSQQ